MLRVKNRKILDADIDYIMKFESLNDDFKVVCEQLDIPYFSGSPSVFCKIKIPTIANKNPQLMVGNF